MEIFEKKKAARRLTYIYQQISTFPCEKCGDCCFNCAETYLIEFFNIYQYLITLPELTQRIIARKTVAYELLNLMSLEYKCPFLEENNECLIYSYRPLQCHFFGIYPEEEYQLLKAQSQKANKELAQFYAKSDLSLPEEVLTYDIDQCHRNINSQGEPIIISSAERNRFQSLILELEREILPPDLLRVQGFRARFSYHFCLNYFTPEELEKIKTRIMREYQKNSHDKIVDEIIDKYQIAV